MVAALVATALYLRDRYYRDSMTRAGTLASRGYMELAEKVADPAVRAGYGTTEEFILLIRLKIKSGSPREAARFIQERLLAEPQDLRLRFMLAEAYQAAGETERALSEYTFTIQNDASAGPAWLGMANSLLTLQRVPEAIATLERATSQLPDDTALWELLGKIYEKNKDLENLAKVFRRLADLHPEIFSYWHDYLELLREIGDDAALASGAAQALAKWPDHRDEIVILTKGPRRPRHESIKRQQE